MARAKAHARFEGAGEVLRNLNRYEKRILNQEMKPGLMAGAELVRDDAARRAPRGSTLRLSSDMVAEWDSRKRRAVVGPHKDAFYGEFIEKGTSHHAAQPFLRPALDSQADAVFKAIAKQLTKAASRIGMRRGV